MLGPVQLSGGMDMEEEAWDAAGPKPPPAASYGGHSRDTARWRRERAVWVAQLHR